jgi:hypothetical protein
MQNMSCLKRNYYFQTLGKFKIFLHHILSTHPLSFLEVPSQQKHKLHKLPEKIVSIIRSVKRFFALQAGGMSCLVLSKQVKKIF